MDVSAKANIQHAATKVTDRLIAGFTIADFEGNKVKILRCATIRCWGECVNLKYRFFGIDFVNIITMIKTNCNTKYT